MIKEISHERLSSIRRRLARLYPNQSEQLVERFYRLVGRYGVGANPVFDGELWSHKDAYLITYANTLHCEDETPLNTLRRFLTSHLSGAFSTVHLLPFYPWSSDDGFSVKDYRLVDEGNGTWEDVKGLSQHFDLMFDLVLNHCSREGPWFNEYLKDVEPARNYFHEADPKTDLSAVTRPRPSPLLTKVRKRDGQRHVWTTFSADQVDLNWSNPDVLFEFLDILFFYISQGATVVRLDAIAFLWKEIGTTCLHLPETHEVVKLLRDVLGIVAPKVILLTETNVPHEENISYFGNGDEAHMVYQFALPPLLLHGLLNDTSVHLRNWAASLPDLPKGCTYLNFTSSHDGIGVRPLTGLIDNDELNALITKVTEREGDVSWRDNGDGTQSPYELNITYFSAMSEPGNAALGVQRFLCSQAIGMSLQGVPALYIHCLFGCENWKDGVEKTGRKRTINRREFHISEIDSILDDSTGEKAQVFHTLVQMLRKRSEHPAFHPDGTQAVLDLPDHLFGVQRSSPDGTENITCIFNFTQSEQSLPLGDIKKSKGMSYRELIKGFDISGNDDLKLEPYQAVWLMETQEA